MTDKPIIFSGPMVRALLDGRKNQTRRLLNPQPDLNDAGLWRYPPDSVCNGVDPKLWVKRFGGFCQTDAEGLASFLLHPSNGRRLLPYAPGDRLYVKHAADCFPVYFKPIPFGAGKYAVGTDGHVYARSEAGWEKRAVRLSHNGYEEINLRYNGEQRPFRVNRLVAEAFYGPAPEGFVCRHMDGSRRNNQPGNLDWGTPEQNSADASAAGSFSGEQASKARLSASDVDAIRASVEPQAVLAERFGITQPTVSKIKSGKRWANPGEAPSRNLPAFQLWRSPIFCPRWASRLTLTVTEVRVQRLQEISEADVLAEGCPLDPFYHDTTADGSNPHMVKIDTAKWISPRGWYHRLWDSLHGPDAWDANPWVVAVSFTVDRRNIDAIPRQD